MAAECSRAAVSTAFAPMAGLDATLGAVDVGAEGADSSTDGVAFIGATDLGAAATPVGTDVSDAVTIEPGVRVAAAASAALRALAFFPIGRYLTCRN